jgi:hypothetical protein
LGDFSRPTKYQQALWQVSDNILKLKNPTDNDYDEADKQLVETAREALDFHWRKIKAEILGEAPLKEPPAPRGALRNDG